MPGSVTLDLREGFNTDEVSIRAAGMPDIRLAAVSTRLQIGRAHSLQLPDTVQALDIELPRRDVLTHVVLLPERPLWVGVSLSRDGQRLEVRQQREAFGYA
jgi:hypothetical protein